MCGKVRIRESDHAKAGNDHQVWEGLTNREIGKIVGTSEQMIKNPSHRAFDKLGVWSRLELAMYVANHGGKDSLPTTQRRNAMGTLDRLPLIPDSRGGQLKRVRTDYWL